MSKNWARWFDSQTSEDKRVIALAALEKLFDLGLVKFWADDHADKHGDPIPDNLAMDELPEEHIYWLDEHKEDLRIPF